MHLITKNLCLSIPQLSYRDADTYT